jgi:hypothetical protein
MAKNPIREPGSLRAVQSVCCPNEGQRQAHLQALEGCASGFTITTTRGVLSTPGSDLVGEIDSINACVNGTGELDGSLIVIEGIIAARGNDRFPRPIPVFAGDGR